MSAMGFTFKFITDHSERTTSRLGDFLGDAPHIVFRWPYGLKSIPRAPLPWDQESRKSGIAFPKFLFSLLENSIFVPAGLL
jgi:hypothetical protein